MLRRLMTAAIMLALGVSEAGPAPGKNENIETGALVRGEVKAAVVPAWADPTSPRNAPGDGVLLPASGVGRADHSTAEEAVPWPVD